MDAHDDGGDPGEEILSFDSAAQILPYRFEPLPSPPRSTQITESDTESEIAAGAGIEEGPGHVDDW